MKRHTVLIVAALGVCQLQPAPAGAAELSVQCLAVRPGEVGQIVVSGSIEDEATLGVTIMLELVPRADTRGTVVFTPRRRALTPERPTFLIRSAPGQLDQVRLTSRAQSDDDIVQLGTAWPFAGSFSAYDTDRSGSRLMNGSVDDNGTFVPDFVTYSGKLSAFAVKASVHAEGVWDVLLSTVAGESAWEAVPTTLVAGTLTVAHDACVSDAECDDGDRSTDDACDYGVCVHDHLEDGGGDEAQRERLELGRHRERKVNIWESP